ncbi:hypothetical protein Hdeb2414_s0003g00092691 [Helianthus debilis subsp. tardiflorus]
MVIFLPFSLPSPLLNETRKHCFFIFLSLFPPLSLLNETREQIVSPYEKNILTLVCFE